MTDFLPLIEELHPAPDPVALFCRLRSRPHCLFLDSALRDPQLGRYSYLAADPFVYFTVPADGSDGLTQLGNRLRHWTAPSVAGIPPFQGGAAGLLSYDLGRSLERVATPRFDEFAHPAMAIGFYDVVIAFDHASNRAWIVSQGLPETEPSLRQKRARERIDEMKRWLAEPPSAHAAAFTSNLPPVAIDQLVPQFSVPGPAGLTSDFSADGYRRAVQHAVEYIRAGDIFQVNLSQRLLFPARDHAFDLYLRLRERNPATFGCYFDLGDFQIVSASPERFVSVQGRQVEARPIKGTRRRINRAEADLYAGDDLQQSEKDRAENVMIVDLLRNDISQVCLPESVRVTQLCRREVYQYVQHLVSAVRGELADGRTALDLVRASFPGGSITGAPKVRAMEIIAELEPTARGPYCGSLGYIGFDGTMDLNILIRTIIAGRGWWQFPVGGGVIAASQPQLEYEETWHKAAGLLKALVH